MSHRATLLSSGTLLIGTENLNFDSFDFNALAGFGAGQYTLFATSNGIMGSLGSGLTGTIDGLQATLGFDNDITRNSLILTVVPEPSPAVLMFGGMLVLLCVRARRCRSSNAAM